MCIENTQVLFDFGSGRIIFGRIMPLGLRKNSNNVSQVPYTNFAIPAGASVSRQNISS